LHRQCMVRTSPQSRGAMHQGLGAMWCRPHSYVP
jgi:hypothetical protein